MKLWNGLWDNFPLVMAFAGISIAVFVGCTRAPGTTVKNSSCVELFTREFGDAVCQTMYCNGAGCYATHCNGFTDNIKDYNMLLNGNTMYKDNTECPK